MCEDPPGCTDDRGPDWVVPVTVDPTFSPSNMRFNFAFCAVRTLTRFSSSSARSFAVLAASASSREWSPRVLGAWNTDEVRVPPWTRSLRSASAISARSRALARSSWVFLSFAASFCALSSAPRPDSSSALDASLERMVRDAAVCIASTSFFSSVLMASLSCTSRLSFSAICALSLDTNVSTTRDGPLSFSRSTSSNMRVISPC
mmetsp:Transcript_3664/g.16790  ORF Transcript_3664/g.16790 Transcript_3664/m.16790 type:complete len:204 (+) Transcript_3664:1487-2098(+)